MLSQKLLDEIMRLDKIVDNNYYEEKTETRKPDAKTGFQEYIKDTVKYNLGDSCVDLIL